MNGTIKIRQCLTSLIDQDNSGGMWLYQAMNPIERNTNARSAQSTSGICSHFVFAAVEYRIPHYYLYQIPDHSGYQPQLIIIAVVLMYIFSDKIFPLQRMLSTYFQFFFFDYSNCHIIDSCLSLACYRLCKANK